VLPLLNSLEGKVDDVAALENSLPALEEAAYASLEHLEIKGREHGQAR